MTFDVSKFLALTALLAGAGISAAACSSDNNDGNGGTAGTGATSSNGGDGNGGDGSNNVAGSMSQAGKGGTANGVVGGAAGAAGEVSVGGAEGNAGGAGGATGEAGAGGAAECQKHDPSYEDDPCADIPMTDCDAATEGFLNSYIDTCSKSYKANSAARISYSYCIQDKGATECDAKAAETAAKCWTEAIANICPLDGAADLCTTVVGTCGTGLSKSTCTKMASTRALHDDDAYVISCMDPAGEFYDTLFTGDCKARLEACSYVPAL